MEFHVVSAVNLVDAIRMTLWVFEIWLRAGTFDPEEPIDSFRLAEVLDPGAIWIDSYGKRRESKWAAYVRLSHLLLAPTEI
ncbi:hypothetical protein [Roseateles flavus]|uniref:Uncharacterized protein n=1 Tax=Roseateles flavus TaxID=3149041 RepID=A0ABV0GK64_9BURK